MRTPEIEKRLEAEGAQFIPPTPQSFAALQRAEADKWAKAIRDANIKIELGRLVSVVVASRRFGAFVTNRTNPRNIQCIKGFAAFVAWIVLLVWILSVGGELEENDHPPFGVYCFAALSFPAGRAPSPPPPPPPPPPPHLPP